MNTELKKVKKWLDANKLALNIEKTNFVPFHSPTWKFYWSYLEGKTIREEKFVKFLGVLSDETQSFRFRLAELSKKLSGVTGILFKCRHLLPQEVLKTLYYATFFPFIQYGIFVWGLTHKSYLNSVYIIQKRVIKANTFNDVMSQSGPLFHQLEILKLQDAHILQTVSFVFNCVRNLGPEHFSTYFQKNSTVHHYNPQQASREDLFLFRGNTDHFGLKSIQFFGAKLWNTIPVNLRNSLSFSILGKEFKTLIINSYEEAD